MFNKRNETGLYKCQALCLGRVRTPDPLRGSGGDDVGSNLITTLSRAAFRVRSLAPYFSLFCLYAWYGPKFGDAEDECQPEAKMIK